MATKRTKTTKPTKNQRRKATLGWLLARTKSGRCRIHRIDWWGLYQVYTIAAAGSPVRQAVLAEVRRRGARTQSWLNYFRVLES